jgi:hypothetical protein
MNAQASELPGDGRSQFGANWRRFPERLNHNRISLVEESLCIAMSGHDLHGKAFLDVGCGSRLSCLAERWLGAEVLFYNQAPQLGADTRLSVWAILEQWNALFRRLCLAC